MKPACVLVAVSLVFAACANDESTSTGGSASRDTATWDTGAGTDATTGTEGVDGVDGTDGTNGVDGTDATDGADATDVTDTTDGTDQTEGTDASGIDAGGTDGGVSCVAGGDYCSWGDTLCCDGFACIDQSCQACSSLGAICTANKECCTERCKFAALGDSSGTCVEDGGCQTVGGPCTSPNDCCFSNCDLALGKCACRASGESCALDFHCCSGTCLDPQGSDGRLCK